MGVLRRLRRDARDDRAFSSIFVLQFVHWLCSTYAEAQMTTTAVTVGSSVLFLSGLPQWQLLGMVLLVNCWVEVWVLKFCDCSCQ